MEYRLEKKEAFPILGVCVLIERDLERNFEILPAKWQEVSQNGSLQRLLGLMEGQPMGVLGVSVTALAVLHCRCLFPGGPRLHTLCGARRHLGHFQRLWHLPVHPGAGAPHLHRMAAHLWL